MPARRSASASAALAFVIRSDSVDAAHGTSAAAERSEAPAEIVPRATVTCSSVTRCSNRAI
jgi:hypothetical protein